MVAWLIRLLFPQVRAEERQRVEIAAEVEAMWARARDCREPSAEEREKWRETA